MRVVVDVAHVPVAIVPAAALDMSRCGLRSDRTLDSSVALESQVRARLLAPLAVVGGDFGGGSPCQHHSNPVSWDFRRAAVCEVLQEAVATRIAALESFARGSADLSVRPA